MDEYALGAVRGARPPASATATSGQPGCPASTTSKSSWRPAAPRPTTLDGGPGSRPRPTRPPASPRKGIAAHVYDVNDVRPGRLWAATMLSDLVNLGARDEDAYLSVHPTFGPWYAMRALVVFDGPLVQDEARLALPRREVPDTPERRRSRGKPRGGPGEPGPRRWIKMRSCSRRTTPSGTAPTSYATTTRRTWRSSTRRCVDEWRGCRVARADA